MNRRKTAALIGTGLVLLVALVWLARLPLPSARSVTLTYVGSTNTADGKKLHSFRITNIQARDVTGFFIGAEVYHGGMWFNASPQPNVHPALQWESNGVTYVQPFRLEEHTAFAFSLEEPTGRAEAGLVVQSTPPGENWRAYTSYTARTHSSFAGHAIWKITSQLHLTKQAGWGQSYAFSPALPFSTSVGKNTTEAKQPAEQ